MERDHVIAPGFKIDIIPMQRVIGVLDLPIGLFNLAGPDGIQSSVSLFPFQLQVVLKVRACSASESTYYGGRHQPAIGHRKSTSLVLSRESRAGTPDRSLQCHLTHDDDHDDGATVVPISTITS
jgi:hypothetical protein